MINTAEIPVYVTWGYGAFLGILCLLLSNSRFVKKWRKQLLHPLKPKNGSSWMHNRDAVRISPNLTPPREPAVTYGERLRFVSWTIQVMVKQALADFQSLTWYRPVLSTDAITHYFYIPVGRRDPRLVISGPHRRMTVRLIPPQTTRQYEELTNITSFPATEIINCASNNYGGFSQLEPSCIDIVEMALLSIPFAPAPDLLEQMVRHECAAYMDFEACVTTPSGFSSNVLAFNTVAETAAHQGRPCVFLCDRDCHNSMFTGAYQNKTATVHKFDHNDITDLEYKLRMYRQEVPDVFICVAIEGLYSMEGSISPGPAILALKRIYDFALLVDEAHSFMSLGSSGRGSFNHWEDAGYECPLGEVDVMTCMFSKSVGCTGGMVLARGLFAQKLMTEDARLQQEGVETLSTIVLLRILSLMRKPLLIRDRMQMLRAKAKFVANKLAEAGCKVLSSPGSPIICFPVGTVRQVAVFHGEALKRGIAIVGGVPPATPLWGCRIRMCIFATTAWTDIEQILKTTFAICRKIRVPGVVPIDPQVTERDHEEDPLIGAESVATDTSLQQLVKSLAPTATPCTNAIGQNIEVLSAGASALRRYGIGPCSARWFYGSFDVFIELEQRLANLYPSISAQAGRCRAMICGDAEVTIGSTLAACAAPHASKAVKNFVFISEDAPTSVHRGAQSIKPGRQVIIQSYKNIQHLCNMIAHLKDKKTYITLYLQTVQNDVPLDLSPVFETIKQLPKGIMAGTTIMFDDRNGLGKIGPQKLGYLDLMESTHGNDFLLKATKSIEGPVSFLVAGSWYDAFGHQGGYVTGTADLVESLTWNAKAFFFSTPPMPLQAAMSSKALELLQNGIVN